MDIEKLSKIMVPSDDIIRDLTMKANEMIKEEEQRKKEKALEESAKESEKGSGPEEKS